MTTRINLETSRPYLYCFADIGNEKASDVRVTALVSGIRFPRKDRMVVDFILDEQNTVENFFNKGCFLLQILDRTANITKTLIIDCDPLAVSYPVALGHNLKGPVMMKLEANCIIRK